MQCAAEVTDIFGKTQRISVRRFTLIPDTVYLLL